MQRLSASVHYPGIQLSIATAITPDRWIHTPNGLPPTDIYQHTPTCTVGNTAAFDNWRAVLYHGRQRLELPAIPPFIRDPANISCRCLWYRQSI